MRKTASPNKRSHSSWQKNSQFWLFHGKTSRETPLRADRHGTISKRIRRNGRMQWHRASTRVQASAKIELSHTTQHAWHHHGHNTAILCNQRHFATIGNGQDRNSSVSCAKSASKANNLNTLWQIVENMDHWFRATKAIL